MSEKSQTPQKIMVIEYKGMLFKTQEEYNAFIRKELKDKLTFAVSDDPIAFIDTLLDASINTKAKLEALRDELIKDANEREAELDEEFNVKVPGVNCNEEPEDEEALNGTDEQY